VPLLFLKATTSLIGPGETIVLPPESERVDHECELAIVIGKTARRVSKDEALDAVLGYTLANDVTARDLQRKDGQWARAKSFDTFCPLGPWIDTDFDPYAEGVTIRCKVNDEVRQESPTDDMIHKVADVIAYASAAMTLEPGDVIITGTPSGISALKDGDEVMVEITGLGELTNPCKNEA
jgi:2-keto-4-pentenoate hydratase/2-oxohepta-3-ene-1,7-dioic acid hydratase in catechol pathway